MPPQRGQKCCQRVERNRSPSPTPAGGPVAKPEITRSGRVTPFLAPGKRSCPQRPPGTCSPAPRPTPPAPCLRPGLALFSGSISPWFVLSNNLATTNTRAIWLCFGAFLSPPASSLQFHWSLATGHWLLTTILPSHAPRRDQRVQVVRRPFAAGYCLIPPAELARPNGARSRRALPFFQYGTKPGDPYGKIHPFFLARRRWTGDHSLAAGGAQRQWL